MDQRNELIEKELKLQKRMEEIKKKTNLLVEQAKSRNSERLHNARKTMQTQQNIRNDFLDLTRMKHKKIDFQVTQVHKKIEDEMILKQEMNIMKKSQLENNK